MKNQPHHHDCPFCQWVTNKPEFAIAENDSFLALANISPDVEGHLLIITKAQRTNITQLTEREWNDLLPILSSVTNKLTNTLQPLGFNIYSNSGAEGAARQAVFHFHLHVIPEREGNRGVGYLRKPWFTPSETKFAQINETLQTNEGILQADSHALAQLVERDQASDAGHLTIKSKNIIANLNQVDAETWQQMGQLLRTGLTKLDQLNPSSCRTLFFLGQIGGLKQTNNLQIHLIPRYQSQGHQAKEVIPIPAEVLELAERLRQTESEVVETTQAEQSSAEEELSIQIVVSPFKDC
ncbi:MAG: hypothetical protein GBAus27B_000586 [Mycoplasmataceae bacterium]|nr:MAG: hypothetical protein GBAus27B_000586 [Mycoplasmataceae bacterium]